MKMHTLWGTCLLSLLAAGPVYGADDEFIAFPGTTRTQTTVDDSETRYTAFVDLFYSADFGEERRFKVLAEAIISEFAHDMQRLQLGWQVDDDHALWLGRYHTPIGYWNTEYHHGVYLQTAITRPALMNFEGASGVLPTHFTGLLLEGTHVFVGGSGIDYIVAAGETAMFDDHHSHLEPVDVFDPDASDGETGVALRLGFRPDALADNQLGLTVARSDFVAAGDTLDEVRQTVLGLYANWQWDKFRVISELMRVEHEFQPAATSTDFTSLYAQGEHRFHDAFTVFARSEKTWNAKDDAFLQLLPRFAVERHALGVRYDFRQWQALTIELAHRKERLDSYEEILVQWSAVLP